ncbi:MAG: LysR family transcriptional regulator [Sphingobium sp.]|nr:LysR family transcriptional regulator [Sphingobium sp.]
MANVQKIDLNLFRLLQVLYEERSVARASERLFITRSAVSHALRRLRHLLGDDLFVRGPGGMVPTARAHEVARELNLLLPQLYEVVTSQDFEPSRSERVFKMSCLPYLSSTLVPAVAWRFGRAAPHARLDVTHLYYSVVDDLDSGALDVAIGNFRRTPSRLIAEEIVRDHYVWVIRQDNPAARRKLTLQMLAAMPQVDLAIGGAVTNAIESYDVRQGLERLVIQNSMGATEDAFSGAGLTRQVRYTAPGAAAGMEIAARTNSICFVPAAIAARDAAKLGLAIFDPPYRSPPLLIQMLYHADFSRRPAVAWLLERIRESAKADWETPA